MLQLGNDTLTYIAMVAGAAGLLAGAIVPFLLKNVAPVRTVAIGGADYVEAVKEAVIQAEKTGFVKNLPGFDKFALAVKQMDKWMDEAGIEGDARRMTLERIKQDIELTRAELQRQGWQGIGVIRKAG